MKTVYVITNESTVNNDIVKGAYSH